MLLLLAFLYLLPVDCSSAYIPRLEDRIVGGSVIDIKDMPYLVSLQGQYHFCGGSLIAKHYVLTAAHCTKGHQDFKPLFKVRIGSSNSHEGGLLVNPLRIHQHPQFDDFTLDYDYSLLELEDYDLKALSYEMIYAKMPRSNEVVDDTFLTVSGWGSTLNPYDNSYLLRAVDVQTVNENVCKEAYRNRITERMLCAGSDEGGKDSCHGDSGGPLVYNGSLVGVVSWGAGCAIPELPGVYARVYQALPWIAEITGLRL
uniref:trypsin n=1 Tax=Haematobia irritans TaxID=7368 RepID=A0A1L8EG37_HAEIR